MPQEFVQAKGPMVPNWMQILAFEINMSAIKVPVPINKVSMSKLTIEEHSSSDKTSTKAKFASLEPPNPSLTLWDNH